MTALRFSLTSFARADIMQTYDTVCNIASYPMLIPQHYPSVRVLSVRSSTSVAEEHVMLGGRELVIMARHVALPPRRHETFVIGGDAKGSHIIYEFEEEECRDKEAASAHYTAGESVPACNLLTRITTTASIQAGRLGVLSRVRLGSTGSLRRSLAGIVEDLAHIAEDQNVAS